MVSFIERQPERYRRYQLLGTDLIGGQPDPPESSEKLFCAVNRFSARSVSCRTPFSLIQQSNGVLTMVTADGTELLEDKSLLLPGSLKIALSDCRQVFSS